MERWPDGSKFEGSYMNGVKQGYGKFTWADQSTYTGTFVENNIEGNGKSRVMLAR